MANKARWIHRVRVRGGVIEVLVGASRYSTEAWHSLDTLPRHEVRRVCAHLGFSGDASRTKDSMLEDVRSHCADSENVDGDGIVSPSRGGSRVTSGSGSSVARGGSSALGSVLEAEIDARVAARVDEILSNRDDGLDTDAVRSVVLEEIERSRALGPRVIHVNGTRVGSVDGPIHRQFDRLLGKIASGRNVFITGEAGIGKTFVVSQIAEALGVPDVIVSADPLPQRSEILGYVSPTTREAVKGAVRDVYENGGVFCLDEIDTGHTSLGTSLNRLLSSASFDFDKDGGGKERVRRHDSFVVVATGNTFGTGPSIRYVGTNKMNGASLDRFTMFHLETDEDLTREIALGLSAEHGLEAWNAWIGLRRNVERYSLDVLVSPRACLDAVRGLAHGEDLDEAYGGRARGRGLPSDIETKLVEGVLR